MVVSYHLGSYHLSQGGDEAEVDDHITQIVDESMFEVSSTSECKKGQSKINGKGKGTIALMDMAGRVVFEERKVAFKRYKLVLDGLAEGAYFLNLYHYKTKKSVSHRIQLAH